MGERDDPFVRVCVHGIAGAGKTTLAARLADARGCARLELDGLYHQAGWRPIEEATLRAEVGAFVAGDAWVVDGNYRAVRDLLWARATAIVVLDPPRRVVMARVGRRTFARLLTRRKLWNGNRERWRDLLSRSPERNIVRWAWRGHALYHGPLADEARRSAPHTRVVTVRSRADLEALVGAVTPR